MKKIIFAVMIAFLAFMDIAVSQSTNPKISLQGVLREADGVAVVDGGYDLTFRIYDRKTGGDILYAEEHLDVLVSNGVYSVHLGEYVSLSYLPFDQVYYVGVRVGSSEIPQRIELTQSPYTLSAHSLACSGAVGDIKYSLLNWKDFQVANGDCWMQLNGSDIAGSLLATDYSTNVLADMSGLFIRAHEWNDSNDPTRTTTTPIATMVDYSNKSHSHGVVEDGKHDHEMDSAGEHFHYYGRGHTSSGTGCSDNQDIITRIGSPAPGGVNTDTKANHTHTINSAGAHTHDLTSVGDDEARPTNMNLYIYVRIN